MTIYAWFIIALWLVLVVYWAISAHGAKRTISKRAWRREIGLRFVILAIVLLALRVPAFRHAMRNAQLHMGHTTMLMGIISVMLCGLGIGLAIWARATLGRNWGMPMSRKENPELVTTGPYAFVRHPIYGGLLLAMLGSALGVNMAWLIIFALAGLYFFYSARREEKLMIEQFPQRYAAYRQRTKMMVPFIL